LLSLLRIRNLAIIDELEVELGPGLNALTGETGAGKSILVHALKLVLGGRSRPEMVRTGASAAEVEALFELRSPELRSRLQEAGIEVGEELVVRRVVAAEGRSRAFLNGRLCSATELEKLAAGLVDISSQHEHHSLVDASTHVDWLDAVGRLGELGASVAVAAADLAQATAELRAAEAALRQRAEREDLLKLQLAELRKLAPKPGEEEAIAAELDRMRYAERLVEAAGSSERMLVGAHEAMSIGLGRVVQRLREASRHDASLLPLADRAEGARLDIIELGRDLGSYARSLDLDAVRLQELEDRQHALKRAIRKHGADLAALLAWKEQAEAELAGMADGELRVEEAGRLLSRQRDRARELGQRLSLARREAAQQLSAQITAELSTLGMGGARVEVTVVPLVGRGELEIDGLRFGPRGFDHVEFQIAPNPGEAPRPLRQVASGGELSRSLLALKRVLAGGGPGGTYVFDEVDTGVGGAIAEVIGRKLAEIAAHGHQVLCITHLPQVAAYADRHLRVGKRVLGGRTVSGVQPLSSDERLEELARMLGGIEVTAGSRQAARDLLEGARAAW
jgi:DNA repair protein RecN (Recombination protein N)